MNTLLPVLDSLSSHAEGGDGRVSPASFLQSAFHSGQKRMGQNQTLLTGRQGSPAQSGEAWWRLAEGRRAGLAGNG